MRCGRCTEQCKPERAQEGGKEAPPDEKLKVLTLAPDGKHLAFVRRVRNQSTLFIKDLQTGAERALWGGLSRDLQEAWSVYGVYPGFAWTPDSQQLVVWAQGKLWRVQARSGHAAEIPFHVRHTREVREALRVPQTVAPDTFDVKQLRHVQVSPDGRFTVYSALGHLWQRSLERDDAPARRLSTQTEHFEFQPSISRDGKRVAYISWNDREMGRVRVRDLASGRETVVTPEPEPSVSCTAPTRRTVRCRSMRSSRGPESRPR